MGDKVPFQAIDFELGGLARFQVMLEQLFSKRGFGPEMNGVNARTRIPMCAFQRIATGQEGCLRRAMYLHTPACICDMEDLTVVVVETSYCSPTSPALFCQP